MAYKWREERHITWFNQITHFTSVVQEQVKSLFIVLKHWITNILLMHLRFKKYICKKTNCAQAIRTLDFHCLPFRVGFSHYNPESYWQLFNCVSVDPVWSSAFLYQHGGNRFQSFCSSRLSNSGIHAAFFQHRKQSSLRLWPTLLAN